MGKVNPVQFEMYLNVRFSTNIRGHHVYKDIWVPKIGESLVCKRDKRLEAKELDEYAIGAYKKMTDGEFLVGHLPKDLCFYSM